MLATQSNERWQTIRLFYYIILLILAVLFLIIISGVCSTPEHSYEYMFVSEHIMRCKDTYPAIPLISVYVYAIFAGIMFHVLNETHKHFLNNAFNFDIAGSVIYILLFLTVIAYNMIVAFEHRGSDTTYMHFLGVSIFFPASMIVNFAHFQFFYTHSRSNDIYLLATEGFFQVAYCAIFALFVIFWVVRLTYTAVVVEYVLVGLLVILFIFLDFTCAELRTIKSTQIASNLK